MRLFNLMRKTDEEDVAKYPVFSKEKISQLKATRDKSVLLFDELSSLLMEKFKELKSDTIVGKTVPSKELVDIAEKLATSKVEKDYNEEEYNFCVESNALVSNGRASIAKQKEFYQSKFLSIRRAMDQVFQAKELFEKWKKGQGV